jgi:F-type H+-transporting ATPase subunit b
VHPFLTHLQATTTLLATAPRAEESQLLDVDGSVVVMLSIFLVLLLILWRFLWRPYLRVRDERVARTEGAREKATQLEADAAARTAKVEGALTDARRAALAEMGKLRQEAQAREQQLIAEAQEAARKMLVEARAKLDVAVANEKANLREQTAIIGRQIAEKALGRSMAS